MLKDILMEDILGILMVTLARGEKNTTLEVTFKLFILKCLDLI